MNGVELITEQRNKDYMQDYSLAELINKTLLSKAYKAIFDESVSDQKKVEQLAFLGAMRAREIDMIKSLNPSA